MFTLILRLNHPSHSCESRNLYAEGGNCKLQELQFPAASRRRRFLPSQEWDEKKIPFPPLSHSRERGNLFARSANDSPSANEIPAFAGMAVLFVFADNTEFGGIRKYKNTPFRRKPESLSCVAGIPPKTAAPPIN
ncbi:MAG: hypothetical protein ACR2QC_11190 [Gammaproteobacteria bacterium]